MCQLGYVRRSVLFPSDVSRSVTLLDPFAPNAARLEPWASATSRSAMGGRLYRDGAGVYCDEAVADMLVARVGHRKTRTEAELLEAVKESSRGLPAVRIWVREGLEALAQRS